MNKIINDYLDILERQIRSCGANDLQVSLLREDVSNRLSLLNRYSDKKFIKPILLISKEESEHYISSRKKPDLCALVNLCIRNSLLEELHTDSPYNKELYLHVLNDGDLTMKEITETAISFFSSKNLENFSGETIFDNYPERYPKVWECLEVICSMKKNQRCAYFKPTEKESSLKIKPKKQIKYELGLNGGVSCVESGVAPTLSENVQQILLIIKEGKSKKLFADSFKHITRNTEKLFEIMEYILNCDGYIATSNFILARGVAMRREGLLKPAHNNCEVPIKLKNTSGLDKQHRDILKSIIL